MRTLMGIATSLAVALAWVGLVELVASRRRPRGELVSDDWLARARRAGL